MVKPLRGFGGAGVLEIVEDHAGYLWRRVQVRLACRKYVLRAFQKKSKSGIHTPRAEIELIKSRLMRAEEAHIRARRLTQTRAAHILRIDHGGRLFSVSVFFRLPRISALFGRLSSNRDNAQCFPGVHDLRAHFSRPQFFGGALVGVPVGPPLRTGSVRTIRADFSVDVSSGEADATPVWSRKKTYRC
jgi:Phage derived protein Gp49-like (DUF891)